MTGLNEPPAFYSGPKRQWEIFACRALLRLMVTDSRIAIHVGPNSPQSAAPEDVDFVLAPPSLSQTLAILLRPDFATGETFINGGWYLKKGELTDFLSVISSQPSHPFVSYYRFRSRLRGIRHYLQQFAMHRHFTRQVRRHYEIDPALYEMILDEEMFYTCAFFDDQHQTLFEAQQNKISTVIARMNLPAESPKVLDIGCGWGAAERALVRSHPSAEICGLSISKSQIQWAAQRDAQCLTAAQVSRIEYKLEDYEHHERTGYYDGICVLGMLEHVGLGGYRTFFAQIARLLKPRRYAVIHTIVSPRSSAPTNRWIDKHIFTGGYAPSVPELVAAIEGHALTVSQIHLHGPENYRATIDAWLANLAANSGRIRDHLKSEGLADLAVEKIVLTWRFYLSAVRNMFDKNSVNSHQVAHVCIRKP